MTRGGERRRWQRRAYAGGWLPPAARVRPGALVTLVNMSRGGALVEGGLRLRFGVACQLEWTTTTGVKCVAARVARCFVARLEASSVRYRTALTFDALVALPIEHDLLAEYQVPGGFVPASLAGVVASQRSGQARRPGVARPSDLAQTKDLTWHRP